MEPAEDIRKKLFRQQCDPRMACAQAGENQAPLRE
jgi:hypothetical protein